MGKALDIAVLTARADLNWHLSEVSKATDPEVKRELGIKIAFTQLFLESYGNPTKGKRVEREFHHIEATGFKVRGLRKAMHQAVKAAHRTWYGVHRTW